MLTLCENKNLIIKLIQTYLKDTSVLDWRYINIVNLLIENKFFSLNLEEEETEFTSDKHFDLSHSDFKQTPSKFIDTLGVLKTSNNMEIVIVETSQGNGD